MDAKIKEYAKYIKLLEEGGADAVKVINPQSVETAPWVQYKCRFGCSSWNTNHYCPPKSPTWKETGEILDSFKYALLFRSPDLHTVTPLAMEVAKELFFDDYYKAVAFGCGPCKQCKNCDPEGKCVKQGKMIPSMEGSGIDVFATVRNNGFEIHTLRECTEIPVYFGLILVE